MTDGWHPLLAAGAGAGLAGSLEVLLTLRLHRGTELSLHSLWNCSKNTVLCSSTKAFPCQPSVLGSPGSDLVSWQLPHVWEEASCWASRGERLCAGSDSRACLQGGCLARPDRHTYVTHGSMVILEHPVVMCVTGIAVSCFFFKSVLKKNPISGVQYLSPRPFVSAKI